LAVRLTPLEVIVHVLSSGWAVLPVQVCVAPPLLPEEEEPPLLLPLLDDDDAPLDPPLLPLLPPELPPLSDGAGVTDADPPHAIAASEASARVRSRELSAGRTIERVDRRSVAEGPAMCFRV
jgi:hypothetical protein